MNIGIASVLGKCTFKLKQLFNINQTQTTSEYLILTAIHFQIVLIFILGSYVALEHVNCITSLFLHKFLQLMLFAVHVLINLSTFGVDKVSVILADTCVTK